MLYCPVCEKESDEFPDGSAVLWKRGFWKTEEGKWVRQQPFMIKRLDICPVCKSFERHRWIALYFERSKHLFPSDPKMLLVSEWPRLASKVAREIGAKATSFRVNGSGRFSGRIETADLPEDFFDVILCSAVLEHIDDDISALKNMAKTLKPGGVVVLYVPVWAEKTIEGPTSTVAERCSLYGSPDHRRRYGPDFPARVESCGFKLLPDFRQTLTDAEIDRFRMHRCKGFYTATEVSPSSNG